MVRGSSLTKILQNQILYNFDVLHLKNFLKNIYNVSGGFNTVKPNIHKCTKPSCVLKLS